MTKRIAGRTTLIGLLSLHSFRLLAGPEQYDPKLVDTSKGTTVIEKSWCETPPPFEIRIGLPMWLAGISGDTGVKGVVNNVDLSLSDILSHLTHVPISLGAEFRYQRWELFGDGQYTVIGTGVTLPGLLFTDANLHLKAGFGEAFLGYRLVNCDTASLSFFAGARYSYEEVHLSIFDNGDARLQTLRQLLGLRTKLNAEGSIDWVDPVIGLRGKYKIWKATSLYIEGDIGGFDANSDSAFETHRQGRTIVQTPVSGSDWSYQIQGGVEVQVTRSIWTQLGWRYLKFDFKSGGFTNETAFNGLILQTGMNF